MTNRTNEPDKRCLRRSTLFLVLIVLTGCQSSFSPQIARFDVAPSAVTVGDPVKLSWRGSGAATCTLKTGQRTFTPKNCDQGEFTEQYTQAGMFGAELVYTAQDGLTLSEEREVTVRAAETSFTTEQDGLSVTFKASFEASVPEDVPAITAFTWDFGDGQTGSGARVTHRYARAGDYLVTLTRVQGAQQAHSSQKIAVAANPDRLTLFSGNDLAAWELVGDGAANWRLEGDYAEVKPGKRVGDNNLRTKKVFGDFQLHLEFWVPKTPPGTPEQARGNSGVYLQGRYEVQILDSFGRTLRGQNDAGAIYEIQDAGQNASLPPETWQRYDIKFRAARFEGGKKVQDARVSVFWNGQVVHENTVIPRPTRLGTPEVGAEVDAAGILTGPIVFQDHGYRVRFRNVWLEPL